MAINAVGGTSPTSPTDPSDPKATERAKLAHLAQEFEAMFISEMMRGMRSSILSDEESDSGLGSATMTDTFDSEFGRAMSNAGGLGVARMMLDAMNRRESGTTASTSAVTALPANVLSAATQYVPGRTAGGIGADFARSVAAAAPRTPPPATDLLTPPVDAAAETGAPPAPVDAGSGPDTATTLPGPVTSSFGWRADPFSGRRQFHAGTDIRLAYGHDVQSVAAGRVTSVGERSGYGLTVVIDHGQGRETRYAHLSSASVTVGDRVDSGQVVAKSGNSGRSTGPHLHLEARQNGRAVDMAALLKSSGTGADSYADDRSSVRSGHED